jgi:hypothetical protein
MKQFKILKGKTILFMFFVIMVSCYSKKEKDITEFSPELITKLDLSETGRIFLEKYHISKKISAEWIKLEYKYKVDTAFSKFKSAKYRFKLEKKLDLDYNYRLTIDIKNKKYKYFFQKFDYDTVCCSNSISHAIESYILNGKKRYYRNSKYYLDYE